jgi:putative transposase
MWTAENRPKYDRDTLRYPSDLTDEEFGYIEPLIPPAERGGRRYEMKVRAVLNGIIYVLILLSQNYALRFSRKRFI